jgi:hypothetical protein
MDRAIALHEPLNRFLRQNVNDGFSSAQSWSLLTETLAPVTIPPAKLPANALNPAFAGHSLRTANP